MRWEKYAQPFLFLVVVVVLAEQREYRSSSSSSDNVTLSRSSRAIDAKYKYLIFPQGSNVQLIYCLTIGTYARPTGTFTMGVTAGLAYELPYRRTVPHRKPAEVYHRRSRRDLYRKLEIMLKAQGKNGRSCILKSLCQAGKRNRLASSGEQRLSSFLDEILHSVFTYPRANSSDDDDEGEVDMVARKWKRDRGAEYDGAYNAVEDCHVLFPECPRIF